MYLCYCCAAFMQALSSLGLSLEYQMNGGGSSSPSCFDISAPAEWMNY